MATCLYSSVLWYKSCYVVFAMCATEHAATDSSPQAWPGWEPTRLAIYFIKYIKWQKMYIKCTFSINKNLFVLTEKLDNNATWNVRTGIHSKDFLWVLMIKWKWRNTSDLWFVWGSGAKI